MLNIVAILSIKAKKEFFYFLEIWQKKNVLFARVCFSSMKHNTEYQQER